MRGKRIQIVLKVGHHRPTSKTPDDDPTMNAGLVALCFFLGFVIFQGGGSRPLIPPLDPWMLLPGQKYSDVYLKECSRHIKQADQEI